MEFNTEETMSSETENRKPLLVEYSKILVGHLGNSTKPSDEEILRLDEIQTLLGLSHDEIMKEASDYLESTVGQ